jgi:WD repeat-containing protein 23
MRIMFMDVINSASARREQIIRLLTSSQLGRLFLRGVDDDDDDDFGMYALRRRRRRQRPDPDRFPKVPSDEGRKLMGSGDFGFNETISGRTITQQKMLARRILGRELGLDIDGRKKANRGLMAQVIAQFSRI